MSSPFDRPSLPSIGWVADLKTEDRDLLASYGEFIPAYPERDLIEQGWNQTHLYMVITGKLEVRREGLERDLVVGYISPGESIGEVSIFDPGPASASVRAVEFSQIWRIDRDSLNSFLGDNPGAGNLLMVGLSTILSKRIRSLSAQLVDAKTG